MPAITAIPTQDIAYPNDLIIYVSDTLTSDLLPELDVQLAKQKEFDPRVGVNPTLVPLNDSKRCLHVPSPNLGNEYEDVRCFFALGQNIGKCIDSLESVKPLLILDIKDLPSYQAERFTHALGQVYLGICQQQWQPLEAREALGETNIEKLRSITLFNAPVSLSTFLSAAEQGKRVARDLCGTEPERMAPPMFAEYCEQIFKGSSVTCQVEHDLSVIKSQYPLLYSVARASLEVQRHQPRVIKLSYQGDGPITQRFYFAGKGITYDTGGADLKVGGHMAGMSRDKGGAAGVAGLMYALAKLKPKGIYVSAQIGAVRNSIGAEAYVPDEIIKSHAGVRVRVGNTDAEGRMLLADLLSHLRLQAINDQARDEDSDNTSAAQLYSVATLTGHALIALGPYTALIENACAKEQNIATNLCEVGEKWGDPCEQSLLRKEDFAFIQPSTKADDVMSSNNKPSVSTIRGHQFPAAFLAIASGLNEHDAASSFPMAYTHVDIAGSGVEGMDWQHGKPTGAPVVSFLANIINM